MLFAELKNKKFESSRREEENFLIVLVVTFFLFFRSLGPYFPKKMVSSHDEANYPGVITGNVLLTLNSSSDKISVKRAVREGLGPVQTPNFS